MNNQPASKAKIYTTVIVIIAAVLWFGGLYFLENPISAGMYSVNYFSTGIYTSGIFASGIYSVGLYSAGLFSIGIFSAGLFSIGIFSAGLFSLGVFSTGIFSLGAYIAIGLFLTGRYKKYPKFTQEKSSAVIPKQKPSEDERLI